MVTFSWITNEREKDILVNQVKFTFCYLEISVCNSHFPAKKRTPSRTSHSAGNREATECPYYVSYGTVQCDEANPAEADQFQNRISGGPNI